MTQNQTHLTVDDILSIGRRALDKTHGTEAQHIYIAREVERRLLASGAASTLAQPASVPAGWKLVPVEPTAEMMHKAFCVIESEGIATTPWLRRTLWDTMLAAAPSAPQPAPITTVMGLAVYDPPAPQPEAQPRWIPVEERLPPINTEVLVAFDAISIAATGQYSGSPRDLDRGGWCYPSENYGTCDDGSDPKVTHWMPLPVAPSAQAEPTDTAGALMQQIREVCAATLKAGPGVAVPMPDAVRSEMQLFMRGEPNLIERLPFCDVVALSESEEVQALAAPSAQAEPQQADDWQHLKMYGYAPGNYMSRCCRCGKTVSGLDKRAVSCRACAEELHKLAEQGGK